MKLLLVEDHDGIRETLRMLLELEGFQCETANNCEDAVTKGCDFDVVLLDLNTGGMLPIDYLAELRKMKALAESEMPKVGILSASTGIDFETRRLNADFFVRKPFDHESLVATLNRQLNRAEGPQAIHLA